MDKKEEVQRKVEKEELMNKVDRGERVTQLRDKTSGVLDQIFQTIKKEELMNKVDRGERVTQLRAKTSGVLDQIFQTIKKEENLDKNEEIINRRRERNFDETKVLMRVGQTRGRGKGSGILEQVSDKNYGSFLRVAPEPY